MKKINIISFLVFLFLIASQNLIAQEVYTNFTNPSFEDLPRPQQAPYGWYDCGFKSETPPDTHPVPGNSSFGVNRPPQDGFTYLGMVVRESDTWESVGQRLNEPLLPNECYAFSIFLCTSETYISELKGRSGEVSFTEPVLLRVWGGTGFCNKKELLSETTLIDHHDWGEYTFPLAPTQKHTYIVFETFFDVDRNIPPNGNLLLDNLSPIYSINCNELETISLNRAELSQIDETFPIEDLTSIDKPTPTDELTPKNYSENQVIQYAKSIQFDFDDQLTRSAKSNLKNVIEFVKKNDKQLILCVKIKSEYRNSIQVEHLNNFLKANGLPEKQYFVRKVEPTDKSETWFSQNPFLYIGLQDIE